MSPYAGLGRLLRLAWRRDRLLIVLSGLGLIVLAAGSAQATFALYPDPAQAEGELAAVFDNPATVALYGPLASHSLDALATFKTLFMGAILLVVAVEGVLAHEGGLARAAAGLSVGLWVIVVALRRRMPHE